MEGAAARSFIILRARPAESEATLSFAVLGDLMDGVLAREAFDLLGTAIPLTLK